MELIPVFALRFFLILTVLPANIDKFTMSSQEFGHQEWKLKGQLWVVEDKEGKQLFSAERNGNEVRITTTQKFGSNYCKDATVYVSTAPKINQKLESTTFDVLFQTNSPVHVQGNGNAIVFYQEKERFLFRAPVVVLYEK